MPRVDGTDDMRPLHPFDGVRERISTRSTHASRGSWRFKVAAVVLAVVAAVIGSVLLEPRPAARGRLDLAGHEGLVSAVTFSPDGRTLASCSWDFTVRLWDLDRLDDGHEAEPVILPHETTQYAAAFSPDGSLLVSAGDRSLTIWSCRPGYQRMSERSGESYHSLSFSPDGQTVALGGEDGSVRLWDMPAARERSRLRGHAGSVRSVAFSPDGKLLATASHEGRLVLWDAIRWSKLWSLVTEGAVPIQAVAFSPDGGTLGLAELSEKPGDVVLVDPGTGAIRTRLTAHPLGTHSLAFSPDGRMLATAGGDRCIKLWNVATAQAIATFKDGIGWVRSVAFSPDGTWMAFAGVDESIRMLDVRQL